MIFYRYILWKLRIYLMFIGYVSSEWPSKNFSSQIEFLGLFSDLDNITRNSIHSRAMFKAAIILSHRYNMTIGGEYLGWKIAQTSGKMINTLKSSCFQVSTSNIVGIIGPELSREAHVIAPFAKTLSIPVISYGATDPDLSDHREYPTFFRTIPSDDTAALAIVKLFSKYNWTSCVTIHQNDAFGSGGVKAIDEIFYEYNLTVTDNVIFDIATLTIRGNLKNILRNSPTRIVVVWAQSIYTEIILENALKDDVVGPQFIWILSSPVNLERFNRTFHRQLIGLLTIQAVVGGVVNAPINRTLLNDAYDVWQQYEPESFPGSENVDYFALFAFDATWALIGALQEFCSTMNNRFSPCISFSNTSFCFDRQFINSTRLFHILRTRTFLGISGTVEFSSMQMNRIDGIYYVVKNVQVFFNGLNYVSVLVWSKSTDWISYPDRETNIIVWPGHSLEWPDDSTSILGTTLRIAVVDSEPFTLVTHLTDQFGNKITKLVGYMPGLIDLLQIQMGFIPNITILPRNQSYSQLIDLVSNGLYDIAVADITITAARREKVTFSSSIFDNSLRIIIRESPGINVDLVSYLKPFSSKLWLTLLIATLYAGFVFCFLEREENPALQNRSILSSIGLSMWYSIGTILGYGIDFPVTTAPGRVLTIGLYVLCLISVAAYTANLASDLTTSYGKYMISGIDDLRNGKILSNRIGIIVDSSIEDFYLREISFGIRNFFPLYSKEELFDNLLNNKIDASIMDAGLLEYATNSIYCNLTLIGGDFDRSSFGIVYRKKWQYAQQFDENLLLLRESGALDVLKAKWFQTSSCTSLSMESTALGIESMTGLFLTFIIIIILAVILFIWTNRFTLRNYLLILIRSMKLLVKQRIVSIQSS